MALNARQKLFVKHYLIHKNATQAAKDAGYSEKTSAKIGFENLHKPEIREAIGLQIEKLNAKVDLKAEDVLREIQRMAFSDLALAYDEEGNLLPIKQMPDNVRLTLTSIEEFEEYQGVGKERQFIGRTKKIRIVDKMKALEALAKHFKLLTDVQEITGKDGGPQVVLTLPANGSETNKNE